MRDTDWTTDESNVKSKYSEHTSAFLKHYEVCGRMGYKFGLDTALGGLQLIPTAGIGYRVREWAAKDGFLQYSSFDESWTENIPQKPVKGNIITYESSTWWTLIGLDIGLALNDRWYVGLHGDWYPYLNVNTIDSHYLKLERYIDSMRGGMGGLAEVRVSYSPASLRGMEFMACIGWEGVFPNRGETSTGDIGQSDALILEQGYYSKTKSQLWWFNFGIVLYPGALLIQK
jgi:hypothetical protein